MRIYVRGFRDMAINPDNEFEAVMPKNGRYVARFENGTPHTVAKPLLYVANFFSLADFADFLCLQTLF